MSLADILARKKTEGKENREEAEKALLVFFILFTKFYSRDKRIGFGSDFSLFKDFLLNDFTFKEKDYPPIDFGFSVFGDYMFDIRYKIPPNVVYTVYKKFLIDKKSENCENLHS